LKTKFKFETIHKYTLGPFLRINMGQEKREVIGCLDAGMSAARLEIVLCEREGEDIVALELSTWHETLGWQRQKTIPLAADKLGQLQRLLSRTRNHIEDRKNAAGAAAQVIEFGLRGSEPQAALPATPPTVQTPAVQTEDQARSAIN
jgi:hypothetical protein